MATRGRFEGTAYDLAELLKPHASTAAFLKYSEEAIVTKAPLLIHRFEQQLELLKALHEAQGNLSFPRAVVRNSMTMLATVRADEWKLAAADVPDWEEAMTKRFMNFTHNASQALAKTSKWIMELLPKNKEQTDTYTYGFNKELGFAWRKSKNKKAIPETTASITPGEKDDDLIQASFADGSQATIPFTTAELKQTTAPRERAKNAANDFYIMEHAESHNRLRVALKLDRTPLMVLWEQGQQILQVKVSFFDRGDDDKANTEAAAFIKNIADEYCAGKLAKTELRAQRDKLLQSLPKHKTAMKTKAPITKKPSMKIDIKDNSEAIDSIDNSSMDIDKKDNSTMDIDSKDSLLKRRPSTTNIDIMPEVTAKINKKKAGCAHLR